MSTFTELIVYTGLIVMVSIGAGLMINKVRWQQLAVEHNAAEWVLDSTTGNVEFHWKDENKP